MKIFKNTKYSIILQNEFKKENNQRPEFVHIE